LSISLYGLDKKEYNSRMRILVSGGGTGGHIYPALAVARELQKHYSAELLFLGDINGLETRIVPAAGIPFAGITAGKLRRYLSPGTLSDLGRVPAGMRQALREVRAFKPDAAFTSGGYVSVPAGFAARLSGVPLVMHQQDVPPNLANKLLRPLATRISVSFADSLRYFPAERTTLTGNPVREEVLAVANGNGATYRPQVGLDFSLPVLLVTGGSQGARHLNQVIVEALPRLLPRCQVLHVSGEYTYEETRDRAERILVAVPDLRSRYVLHAYLKDDMPAALAASDVVLCRSGAATLAELAVVGRPSILVPLPPGFTGSPQQVNAEMFVRVGAAQMILDKHLTADKLLAALLPLLGDTGKRVSMAAAARTFAHTDATAKLAQSVAWLAWKRGAK
jgi:UDP-N-acetylglucosamine--N-acetylmuramyl-(pentapeptide) pyrophosphoryl-undecaprenol N-acetylglucosamine transferase